MTSTSDPASPRRRRVGGLIILLVVLATVVPTGLVLMASRTSASFSDAEVLDDNFLGAATVDIELGRASTRFTAQNMAPGDSVTGQVEVTNVGSLPVVLGIEAIRNQGRLGQWLLFDLWLSTSRCAADDAQQDPLLSGLVLPTTTISLIDPLVNPQPELRLPPNGLVRFCLRATLPLSTPNEAQGTGAEIDLVINAVHDVEASS